MAAAEGMACHALSSSMAGATSGSSERPAATSAVAAVTQFGGIISAYGRCSTGLSGWLNKASRSTKMGLPTAAALCQRAAASAPSSPCRIAMLLPS